ncbi:MAG: hypothetical protein JXB33_09905 [Clostridia bacterium]|nr:hypothetical protein [Clostridia bacterium]
MMFEKRKKNRIKAISRILPLAIVFAVVAAVIVSLPSFGRESGYIRADAVEDTIRKYVIQCYALEGSYPPGLDYLAKNYGLILDDGRYVYYYDAFAANIMPDIEVYSRREEKGGK